MSRKLLSLVGVCAWAGLAAAQNAPLGNSPKPKQVAAQGGDIASSDPAVAEAAATRLGQTSGAASQNALLDVLADGTFPQVAKAALLGLANKPTGKEAERAAFAYLHHRDAGVRAAALKLASGSASSRPWVLARLGDASPEVRQVACEVVAKKQWSDALPSLVTLVSKGDVFAGPVVAQLATKEIAPSVIELVGQAPDTAVAAALSGMLARTNFGNEDLQIDLVRGLGRIPGQDGVEALKKYLEKTPEKGLSESALKVRNEAAKIVKDRGGAA